MLGEILQHIDLILARTSVVLAYLMGQRYVK